jgi:hypothetical protein
MAVTVAPTPASPSPTPKKTTTDKDTPVGVRIVSGIVLAIFIISATHTPHSHEVAELGLAFVTGGTLFLSPQLVGVLVAADTSDDKRSSAGKVYLISLTLISTIVIVLAVVGVGPFQLQHQGLSGTRLVLVVALLIVQIVLSLGAVLLWLARWPSIFFSPESLATRRDQLRACVHPLLIVFHHAERRSWFVFLGGALFLVGTMFQFIAGA